MEKVNKIVDFYINGFQTMPSWARALWAIILIKLFVMFVVLRLFFFQNDLKVNFENDRDRAQHVIDNITNP
jgi:Na+/H+ antiporter NhaD/arsenite permease-like protein